MLHAEYLVAMRVNFIVCVSLAAIGFTSCRADDDDKSAPIKIAIKGRVVTGEPIEPVSKAIVSGVFRSVSKHDHQIWHMQTIPRPAAMLANADPRGRFSIEHELPRNLKNYSGRIILYAKKPDGSSTGMIEIEDSAKDVTIALLPAGGVRGRVFFDQTAAPVPDRLVIIGFQLSDADGKVSAKYGGHFGELATTSKDGKFECRGLVAGMRYFISVNTAPGEYWEAADSFVARPGETIDFGEIRVKR